MIDERREFIKDFKKKFGENLERIRKERGKTRKELAEAICVNETSLGAYCIGRALPPIDKIYLLAVMLDCSIVDLVGDNPNVKGLKLAKYRLKRSIEILKSIGLSVELVEGCIIIKETQINISDDKITSFPQNTFKIVDNLLPILVDEIEKFAITQNISLKEAFSTMVFGDKSKN